MTPIGLPSMRRDKKQNVGTMERWISVLMGGPLTAFGLFHRGPLWGRALSLVTGGSMLNRGITGHCGLYQALDVSTRSPTSIAKRFSGKRFSLFRPHRTRIQRSITIAKSKEEVFTAWERFRLSPMFLKEIEYYGAVQFLDRPLRQETVVRVALNYSESGLRSLVALLRRQNEDRRLWRYLREFKQMAEAGEIPEADQRVSGRLAA